MPEKKLSMQEQIKFGGNIEGWERDWGIEEYPNQAWTIRYRGSIEEIYACIVVSCNGKYKDRTDIILDEKREPSDDMVYRDTDKHTFKIETAGIFNKEIVDLGKYEQKGKKEIYDFFESAKKKYEEEQKNPKPKKKPEPARDVLIKKVRELLK